MNETNIMQRVRLALTGLGWRVFRNNVALGWTGTPCTRCQTVLRRTRFGLCTGSSDLVGWKSVKVTESMVGTTIAVFAAIEVKTPVGETTQEQEAFFNAVWNSGGIAKVVRSEDDLSSIT